MDRGHRTRLDRPDLLVGQRMIETLDLTVRFGQQVRYQCAKAGCRRYLRMMDDGYGRCGRCGAQYRRYAEGKFILLTPVAT